jgi:hypothetical protein
MQGAMQYMLPLHLKENSLVPLHHQGQGQELAQKAKADRQPTGIAQERIPDLHHQNLLDSILGATVSLVTKQTGNVCHVPLHVVIIMNRGPKAEVSHQVELTKQIERHLHHQNMDVDSLTIRKELNHHLPQAGGKIMSINKDVKAEVLAAVVPVQV